MSFIISYSLLSFKVVLLKSIHTSATSFDHYKVLKLQQNCSAREIKDAFIILSKEYHPDINKSKDAHKKFIEITEAYKTLSNQDARRTYDIQYHKPYYHPVYSTTQEPHYHFRKDPWKDPSFYENRDRTQDFYNSQNPYYGIKGINKVTNLKIVLICIGVMFVGVSLQVVLIQKSLTFKRHQLRKRSKEAQNTLDEIKKNAKVTTKDEQIEHLKMKLAWKD